MLRGGRLLGGERPIVADVADQFPDGGDFVRRLRRVDAGRELVQHAADALDDPLQRVELGGGEHRVSRVLEVAHLVQQVVQRVGQSPDRVQPDGRRDAGERVRAAHRRRRHRAARLEAPFGDVLAERANGVVGFAQEHAEQAVADRHRPDAAHPFAFGGRGLLGRRRLGAGGLRRRFARLGRLRLDRGLLGRRLGGRPRGGEFRLELVEVERRLGFGSDGRGVRRFRDGRLGGRPDQRFDGLQDIGLGHRFRQLPGRRRRRRGLHLERLALADAMRRVDQRSRIDGGGRVEPDQAGPVAHRPAGGGSQRDQVVGGGPLLRQPGIEALLDRPGAFAVAGQPDHAAGALQRVEGAAHRGDARRVAARVAQHIEFAVDAGQDFLGLLDEDRHQFLVGCRFRLRQRRGGGRRRRLDRRRGQHLGQPCRQHGVGLLDQLPGRGGRLARARLQRRVVEQVGVVGQLLRHLGQLAGGCAVGRRRGEAGRQFAGPLEVLAGGGLDVLFFAALLHGQGVQSEVVLVVGQFVPPRHRHVGAEHAGVRMPREVAARPVGILLQRVDEEADGAEVAGEAGEVGRVGRGGGIGVAADGAAGVVDRRHDVVEAEQRQHARHLLEHAVERGQLAALGGLAEEAVEALLDLAQQARQLEDDRLHRQAVLRLARQFGQPGIDGGRRLAEPCRLQPLDHGAGAGLEALVEAGQLVDAEVDQQQRGGHLDGQRFAHRHRRLAHLAGERADLAEQQLDRAQFERRRGTTGGVDLADERRGVAADGRLVPRRLGLRQRLAQHAHLVGVEQHEPGALVVGRQQGVEVVQPARLGDAGHRRIGAADVIQRVDQQALGHRGATVDQAAQLQVDAGQHPLQVDVDGERLGFQRVEQAAHDPPEAAGQAALRQPLQVGQRLAHLAPRLQARRIPQEAEQGALEADPPHAQLVGRHRPHVDPGQRRTPRQVGEHQVGRVDPRRTDQLQHVAVVREQADRLVGAAGTQPLEIGGQRLQRAFELLHGSGRAFAGRGLPAPEQALDRVEQQRGAAQIEHAQRACRLVDLCDRAAQRLLVALVAEELADARQRGIGGDADLAGQPRQRRRVRARLDQRLRHCHFAHGHPRRRVIRKPGSGRPSPSARAPAWPAGRSTARRAACLRSSAR